MFIKLMVLMKLTGSTTIRVTSRTRSKLTSRLWKRRTSWLRTSITQSTILRARAEPLSMKRTETLRIFKTRSTKSKKTSRLQEPRERVSMMLCLRCRI